LQDEITGTNLWEEGVRSGDLVWLVGKTPTPPAIGHAESRSHNTPARPSLAVPPTNHRAEQEMHVVDGLNAGDTHKRPLGNDDEGHPMEVGLLTTM